VERAFEDKVDVLDMGGGFGAGEAVDAGGDRVLLGQRV
jgi:hypothetical protein